MDNLARIMPAVIRFGTTPGRLLARAAGVAVGFFALFSAFATWQTHLGFAWFLLVCAALLGVAVGLFAWRQRRLSRYVADMEELMYVSGSAVSVPDDAAGGASFVDRWADVEYEASLRTARYFPRVEAAQRAMVAAAGGTVNAPYLKDDLRVTLLAFLGTLLAVPLALLGSFTALLLLLVA